MKPLDIAVLPGDGIGVEVMTAATEVLLKVGQRIGRRFVLRTHPAGAQHYLDTGVALPEATLQACRSADAILFGSMGLPHVRHPDGTEIIPQLDIRFALDLYAGVRPVKTWPGLKVPLKDERATQIDLVLVRENTEGLFWSRGRGVVEGDSVYDTMRISRPGTSRIVDFALKLARKRRAMGKAGRVTNVDKANVFRSMAFWREIFNERAALMPDVATDHAYVDAMALNLVLKPWSVDVMVTENMFGDILSDLIASLVGGMGLAPSGDIGDHHGLFQPVHGSAPDIVGTGAANPTAMILSAAMMLDWLADREGDEALREGALAVESAVHEAFSTGAVTPRELGGRSGTVDITRAVLERL